MLRSPPRYHRDHQLQHQMHSPSLMAQLVSSSFPFLCVAALVNTLSLMGSTLASSDVVPQVGAVKPNRVNALKVAPCDTGYFQCAGGQFCVRQQYNCDDHDDCPDGSDEHNCADSTKALFYNKLFSKRPDEDREKFSNSCVLASPPGSCSCSGRNIYCVSINLTRIPKNLPPETNELDLSGNNLGVVTNHSTFTKRMRNLKTLTGIVRLNRNAFGNLTALTYLNLAGNGLTRLENETFIKNYQLQTLHLMHNPLARLEMKAFHGLTSLRELDLRDCALESLADGQFAACSQLELLWLQSNRLTHLGADVFVGLLQLNTLAIGRNRIDAVNDAWFEDLDALESLSLMHNSIKHISNDNFKHLVQLHKLDLSYNRIHHIHERAFHVLAGHNSSLKSLDLRKNPLERRTLRRGLFDNLVNLTHIYFDDFLLCSFAPNVRICVPRSDGISSLQHLLDNIILRISVWVVAVIACIGNIFVLVGRHFMNEMNAVHSFFIKNLAAADLLMGVYLFIIAVYDIRFRNEYILHEAQWRRSWQCKFSGVIATISTEGSVFILAIITADRYCSILQPFHKRRTMNFALMAMFIVWLASISLAVVPILAEDFFTDDFYGSNGVCLALQIHETFSMGWEYSAFIFCGLNSAAFIFIAYAYIRITATIMGSGIGLRTTQQQQDRNIAKRCAFIVATDCIFWLPIVIIKICALAGIEINSHLYGWVAVFLFPINAALNPVLYTLTTKLFKQQLNRIISHSFTAYHHHHHHPHHARCSNSREHRTPSACQECSNSSFCSIHAGRAGCADDAKGRKDSLQAACTVSTGVTDPTPTPITHTNIVRKLNRRLLITLFHDSKSRQSKCPKTKGASHQTMALIPMQELTNDKQANNNNNNNNQHGLLVQACRKTSHDEMCPASSTRIGHPNFD